MSFPLPSLSHSTNSNNDSVGSLHVHKGRKSVPLVSKPYLKISYEQQTHCLDLALNDLKINQLKPSFMKATKAKNDMFW